MTYEAHTPSIDDLLVHGDFLSALARMLVADEATANDVVQDTWLRAMQTPPRAEGSLTEGRLKGWFTKVVRNLVRDRAARERARGERERDSSRDVVDAAASPETITERMTALDELGRAFTGLPSKYREVLYLRYYEDLSPAALATKLDLPLATAKTRLRRGLELLRADLEQRLGSGERLGLLLLPLTGRTRPAPSTTTSTGLHTSTRLNLPIGAGVAGAKWIAAAWIAVAGAGLWFTLGSVAEPASTVSVSLSAGAMQDPPSGSESRTAGFSELATPTRAFTIDGEREAVPGQPITGRIIYDSTGQGVPYYRFSVRAARQAPSTQSWLMTGRDGRFEAETVRGSALELGFPGSTYSSDVALDSDPVDDASAPSGAARVSTPTATLALKSALDDSTAGSRDPRPNDVRRMAVEDLQQPISVELGPTYLLAFDPPEGYAVEDFKATIVGQKYQSLLTRYGWAPVHGDEHPWVRFSPPREVVYQQPWDWSLELLSSDGAFMARVDADWVRGVHPEVLHVELEPHTVLTGVVRDRAGQPLASASIGLQEPGGLRTHRRRTDEVGRYTFDCLEPGDYTLYVRDPAALPWSESLVLLGGPSQRDVSVERRQSGATVSGRITSVTGTFDSMVFLYLEGRGDLDTWRRTNLVWREENGVMVGDYRFSGIPHGTYGLICNTIAGVPIESRRRIVDLPLAGVDFLIEDDRPVLDVTPVVVAASGEPMEEFVLITKVEGGYLDTREMRAGQSTFRQFCEGVEFEWWICADGYRPSHGTQADLGADGVLRVKLEPGFGVAIHATSIASYSSVPNVTIFADGVAVGETDDAGDIVLDLPTKPQRLAVDRQRWFIHTDASRRSHIDAQTGAFDLSEGFVLAAYLRRVE